jgi:hypothetical protein
LNDDNGFVRFWAVVAAESMEMYEPEILSELKNLAEKDEFLTVQIEAAKTLIKAGQPQYVQDLIKNMENEDQTVVLFAARAFEQTWKLLPKFPDKVMEIYKKLKNQTAGKWYGHDLYAFWSLSQVYQVESVKEPDEVNYGKLENKK